MRDAGAGRAFTQPAGNRGPQIHMPVHVTINAKDIESFRGSGHQRMNALTTKSRAAVTTLGRKRAGDRVNLEVDMIAKYVERLLEERS